MDRRRFLTLGSLAMAPFVGACMDSGRLRVSYHPWIGYETLYLAQQFDWLPRQVTVTRRDSASDSLAALREGRADAAALTLDEVIRAREDGMDVVVVLVFNVSAGADVVIAREGIEYIHQLRGKRIGVETSAVGALLLDRVLDAAGLLRSDVTVVELPPDQQRAAWRSGRVDAVVTYEPTASHIEGDGGVRLIDSRAFPDTVFDVLAVRRDRLDGCRGTLRELIAAHFRALDHLRLNRQDAIYRIGHVQRIPPETVRRALGGVLLPDRSANERYLASDSGLVAAARDLHRQLYADHPPGDVVNDSLATDECLPAERTGGT